MLDIIMPNRYSHQSVFICRCVYRGFWKGSKSLKFSGGDVKGGILCLGFKTNKVVFIGEDHPPEQNVLHNYCIINLSNLLPVIIQKPL